MSIIFDQSQAVSRSSVPDPPACRRPLPTTRRRAGDVGFARLVLLGTEFGHDSRERDWRRGEGTWNRTCAVPFV